MMKLRWVILFTAITVFLTACPEPIDPDPLAVSLTATPTSLTAPGNVTLTATVTAGGPADQVEFFKGTTSLGADTTEPFTVDDPNVSATTTYRAVATKGGVTANSENVTVTVAPQSGVTVALSAAPSSLTAPGQVVLTATITGPDAAKVRSVIFTGGTAPITDTTAPFTATIANVAATTTFTATARDAAAGGNPLGSGTATVTVGSGTTIPATALKVNSVDGINGAAAGAVIALTADITCNVDNCIQLKANQRLVGANTAGTAVAPRTITVSSTATVPAITAIVMASNSTVESLNVTGNAIFRAVDVPRGAAGTITIKDVDVNMTASTTPTFGSPVRVGGVEGATDVADPTPATVNISGVDITGMAIDKTGLEVYGVATLNITNSSLARTSAANANPGVFIVGHTSTIVLDNVRTNLTGGEGISIFKRRLAPAATVKDMKATIKNTNTQFTPAAGAVGIKLSGDDGTPDAELPAAEKMVVQAGSTGNVTNAATQVNNNTNVVQGAPTF